MSPVEAAEWVIGCMDAHGFVPIGGVDPISGEVTWMNASEEQRQAHTDAMVECHEELAELIDAPAESPEHWKRVYSAWLWTHKCLMDNGYNTTDPPSLEVFMGDTSVWHPHGAIGDAMGTKPGFEDHWIGYEAESTCPSNPWFLLEYLDFGDE